MKRSGYLVACLLVSCNCDPIGVDGTDGGGGPPVGCALAGVDGRCGSTCATFYDCGSALYCGAGNQCTADCVAATAETCGAGRVCGAQGQCVRDGTSDGGNCPRVDVSATPKIPTVLLLVDQSGSMTSDFNGMTRWNAVKRALVDASVGVVTALESSVRFGACLYTSDNGGPSCPVLTQVTPAMNNAGPIRSLLQDNSPQSDTPTGESISAVAPGLKNLNVESGSTRLIVLATDGEPDTCAVPNPQTEQAKVVSVDAAKAAFASGVSLVILSVGSGTVSAAHLQDMANAGAGVQAGQPNAPYYVASDPAGMVSAFNTIVRGARSCKFTLSGSVRSGKESTGEVYLNGNKLPYQDPNGWQLSDPSTLELLGASCQTFKSSDTVTLTASFACGSITA